MRRVILAMLLMSVAGYGCAAQSQNQSASATQTTTTVSGDRQGHFARSAGDMSTCVGLMSHVGHPELQFDLNVTPPQTVAAKKYQSDENAIWTAEFRDAGSNATDVTLRNATASASDLDEAWRIVELCAEQG